MDVVGFLCLCLGLLMDLIFFLIHEYMTMEAALFLFSAVSRKLYEILGFF